MRRCGRPSARVVRRLEKESQTEQPRIDGGIAGFRSKRTGRSAETLLRHLDSAGRSTQKRQPRQPRPNRSRTDDHPLGDRLRPARCARLLPRVVEYSGRGEKYQRNLPHDHALRRDARLQHPGADL